MKAGDGGRAAIAEAIERARKAIGIPESWLVDVVAKRAPGWAVVEVDMLPPGGLPDMPQGVVVARNRVLAAAAIVAGAREVPLRTIDGRRLRARLVRVHGALGLAELACRELRLPPAERFAPAGLRDRRFGLMGLLSDGIAVQPMRRVGPQADDGPFVPLRATGDVPPGAPVFDGRGRLAGVVACQMGSIAYAARLPVTEGRVRAARERLPVMEVYTRMRSGACEWDRIEAAARRWIGHAPWDANAWNALAASLRGQERLDEALDAAQRAARLDPDQFTVRWNLAEVLRALGRSREAIEEAEAALRLAPTIGAAHGIIARARAALGDAEGAEAAAARALALAPDSYSALVALGHAAMLRGQHEQALERLRRAAEREPYDPEVWHLLGVAAARAGDREEAERAARQLRLIGAPPDGPFTAGEA